MTANGANSRIRNEVCVLQQDEMTSSPSLVSTPRGDAIQIVPQQNIPLENRPLQGPQQPTETAENTMPTGALDDNLLHTVQTFLIEEQNRYLMDLDQARPVVPTRRTPSPVRSRRGRS